jgi:hypothetical protein
MSSVAKLARGAIARADVKLTAVLPRRDAGA